MIKKINKLLFIITIFIISFFIKNIDVKAEVQCVWYSYQTYIDKDGKTYNSKKYTANYQPVYAIVYKSNAAGKNFRMIYKLNSDKFSWEESKGEVVYGRDQYNTVFKYLVPKLPIDFESNDNTYTTFTDAEFDKKLEKNGCDAYPYVKVTRKTADWNITSSTKTQFKSWLQKQYECNSDWCASKTVYDEPLHHTITTDNFFYGMDDGNGYGTMHFTNEKKAYDDTNYKKVVDVYVSSKNSTEEEAKNLLASLGIDFNTDSTRYYLYTSVKDIWFNKVDNAISEYAKGNMSAQTYDGITVSFARWFAMVQRFIFEEDLNRYLTYLNVSKSELLIEDDIYDTIVEIVSGLNKIDSGETKITSQSEDRCHALCVQETVDSDGNIISNGQAETACQSSNRLYKKCIEELNYCEKNAMYDLNNCFKGRMGSDYDEYEKAVNNYIDNAEQLINEGEEQISDALSRVELPTMNIKVGKKYDVQCSDVSIFHTIYVIITIAAPVLVVVLGSLDYAQAVLASDEKKMQESKKKLPKRIIALVLLILVPLFIKIILGLFTNLDSSLLDCVVNG